MKSVKGSGRVIKFRALKEGKWLFFNGIFNDPPVRFNADSLGQFTGLHDKNGKEIYEGDIVFGSAQKDVLGTIIWNAPTPGFVTKIADVDGIWLIGDRVEVIGNIYETPELLK